MPGPWQSREEYLVDDALARALAGTREQLEVMRPIALPQQLFPNRLGFRQMQPTITDVFAIGREGVTNRSWLSGMPVRPAVITDQTWSSGTRNSTLAGGWV